MDGSTAMSRHHDSIGQAFLWVLLLTLLLVLNVPGATYAQEVVTNIEATTGGSLDLDTDVNTVGTITEIRGGTRPGNGVYLFHSLDFFTLGSGDTAHFLNDMQRPTTNIFARVIGGEFSTIDGTLLTNNPLDAADPMNFGTANLWLVNPSGLLLGPNARVEVGGSVSMSTANNLGFVGTATLFDMLSSPTSLGQLDIAPVVAFGFTSLESPAPITVQGSLLQAQEGQSLSLVGGDITIQAHTFEDETMQPANLLAPGGQMNLVSVASPGEVLVPGFQTDSFTAMGTVTIEGSTLDVSGQLGVDTDGNPIGGNSGTLLVRGGQLVMDASTILATTVGTVDGSPTAVDIQVSQDVTLSNGAAITTQTFAPGSGGEILITSGTVQLDTGASINSFTFSDFEAGAGGGISLNVSTLTLMGSALIQSLSQTASPGFGQGGNVTVQGLQGEGSAAESVSLFDSSSLGSQTFASGDGGLVTITSKSVVMDGAATISASTFGEGRGGDIVVSVQEARLSGGSTIKSDTTLFVSDTSAGGAITVQALGVAGSKSSLTLDQDSSGIISRASGEGRLGDVVVRFDTVSLTNGAVIQVGDPSDPGTAGNVTIDADSVGISGGSIISSQAFRSDAGQVTITANALTMDNGAIKTNTSFIGRGGDVVLDVRSISLSNGVTINSSSEGTDVGAGDAGNVTITSLGAFTSNASTIATSAENARGGDILIDAQNVQLSNGTLISASSRSPLLPDGTGNAGNITINSDLNVVMQNSSVTTEASDASGGDIEINASDTGMIQLVNSKVSTSVKGVGGDSDGGNISIDPLFVILQNSQLVAQANAGAGGAINVIAGVFIADPSTLVSATSQSGPQGTVNIQSPVQNVGGELAALSDEFASAAALLAQQCAARVADGKFSTFVIAGREGLPVEPGGFLASPSWMTELRGSRLSGLDQQTKLSAAMDLFPKYEVRPIQLAKFEPACHR
jgi:filamentous hemagglutinin family protein